MDEVGSTSRSLKERSLRNLEPMILKRSHTYVEMPRTIMGVVLEIMSVNQELNFSKEFMGNKGRVAGDPAICSSPHGIQKWDI